MNLISSLLNTFKTAFTKKTETSKTESNQSWHMESDLIPEKRFEQAVNFVLENEGGYTNDKEDSGGVTNYGISLRFYKENIDIHATAEDIEKLTRDKACEIYRQYFWDKYRYEAINDINVAIKIFDLCVNMGAFRAHKIAQICCNIFLDRKLKEDGVMGGITISAINLITNNGQSVQLLNQIRYQAKSVYIKIADMNPKNKVFLKGWLTRAGK